MERLRGIADVKGKSIKAPMISLDRAGALAPVGRERRNRPLTLTGAREHRGAVSHPRPPTVSRSFFKALNAGVVEAAMSKLSPVLGLRPWRGARVRVKKVPNPAMATGSSRARASPMAANTTPTMRSAVALVADVSSATWETSSFLFIFASP